MDRRLQDFMLLDDLLSSSSSEDDSSSGSEEELDEIMLQMRRKKPRVENYIETVIVRYTAVEFRQNFRSLSSKFGVGEATAWRAVKRCVEAICEYRTYFITWPIHGEAEETSLRVQQRHGFPGVIGAIDGSHVKIAMPLHDSQSYINRKGVHSIHFQIVCNDKLAIVHCFIGYPGSVHDARVFRHSGIQQRCNEEYFPQDTHLLGDAAYLLQRNVMVPFRDNAHLTIEETHFNTILSSARMMVERCIGVVKSMWRCLLDKLPMRLTQLIPEYILCACILHNLHLRDENTFEYPIIIPDNIDANQEPMDVPQHLHQEGMEKRDNIVNIVNADVE